MSRSRREFIQLAGFSIAALGMSRLPSWLAGGRTADLPSLGMHLRIPATWHFVSGAELELARDEAILPGGEAAKARVMAMAGQPLLVAAREWYPSPGPTLVVWRQPATDDDHAPHQHEEFAGIHEYTYSRYAPHMRDFTVVEGGRAVHFAGSPASSVVVQFRDESIRGTSWLVRLESRMLRWEHSWLTFNFLDLADAWTAETQREFGAIEGWLEFYPPSSRA